MKKRLFFRLPILPVFLFFISLNFSANNLVAQAIQTQVKISVRIVETGYANIDDKGKNKLVWKFYKGDNFEQGSVLTNDKLKACFQVKSKKNNKTKEIDEKDDDLKAFLADISGFVIGMEAWLDKKGGEQCIANQKDENYSKTPFQIKPDILPNDWSKEIKIVDQFKVFYAVIVYKYELIDGLSEIEFGGNNLINDVSKNTELGLPIKLPKKETISFSWSYSIEDQNNWTTIPNSTEDKSKITINPLKDIFGNDPLLSPKKVDLKAEVLIGGKIETSKTLTLTFAPPPPSFNKEKDMQVTPVCNGLTNGTVEIKNINATASEIKYVLIKNPETGNLCNLKDASAELCPGFINAGKVPANKTLRIKSLEAGEYLLYMFNANLESGEVNTATRFTITELTPFKIIDLEYPTKDPTCTNEKGGEIYMNVEGAANLWQIAIIPNKGDFKREGNRLFFKNLEAGKYTVYLSDQCGPEKSRTFTLKKPKQISINTNGITTLLENTEFYILLNVLNGTNNYKVKVTDPENMVTEDSFPFLPEIKLPISKIGIHSIEIIDIATPNCQPARIKIKIEKSSKKEKFKFNVIE